MEEIVLFDILSLAQISRYTLATLMLDLQKAGVIRVATFEEVMGVVGVFENTGRNEKAVTFLEYASQLEPQNTEIMEKLARNFEESKSLPKAAKYYGELARFAKSTTQCSRI
jgi:hypothetical protein